MYLQDNLVQYLRTHALKACDDGRHVDAELFTLAANEIEYLRRDLDTATRVAERETDDHDYDSGYYK